MPQIVELKHLKILLRGDDFLVAEERLQHLMSTPAGTFARRGFAATCSSFSLQIGRERRGLNPLAELVEP